MLAGNLATDCPTVTTSTPVLEAVRRVADRDLEGLIVIDDHGAVVRVLTGVQVLALAVPAYCLEDPLLAHLVDESSADRFISALGSRTVGDSLPSLPQAELPIVPSDATALEMASLMATSGSAVVAVVDGGVLRGAVTMQALLDNACRAET